MSQYLVHRLLFVVPILLGASLLVFVVGRLAPGDPVHILFGDMADPRAEARARAELGLDRPIWQQYLRYLGRALRGDLGVSYAFRGRPISAMVGDAFPITVQVGLSSIVVAVAAGLPLGVIAAVYRGSAVDRFSRLLALAGMSVPSFVVAIVFILVLAVQLHLLPVGGWGKWQQGVMPVLVLALRPMAYVTRLTRTAMLQVFDEDYIRTARSKGLPERLVVLRHTLRNAAITILTTVGIALSLALTGGVVVESVFGIPGMGRAAVQAVFQRDYPMIQAVVLLYTTIFLGINLVTDLLYAVMNPRIRYH
ncbi:MAG: ABC transporter permease [Armatimonadetes bacterium]|nr:ABC transporter permease [Armatimonadota bacterium]